MTALRPVPCVHAPAADLAQVCCLGLQQREARGAEALGGIREAVGRLGR